MKWNITKNKFERVIIQNSDRQPEPITYKVASLLTTLIIPSMWTENVDVTHGTAWFVWSHVIFFSAIAPTHDNPLVHFIRGRNSGRPLLRREQKIFLASRPFLWPPLSPFSTPPIAIVVTLRPPRELHPAYKGTISVSDRSCNCMTKSDEFLFWLIISLIIGSFWFGGGTVGEFVKVCASIWLEFSFAISGHGGHDGVGVYDFWCSLLLVLNM